MKITKIGVLTSGGDVPGLNAALHAIVLTASKNDIPVVGINEGYDGLIDGKFHPLEFNSVQNIMDEGGTLLRTSRSARFMDGNWRKKAYHQLLTHEVDGLIIVGGNGSLTGAGIFSKEFNIPLIGIPKTIDNDVYGTDYAIGFDTATNTIVEAIDKIKDTADSTSRVFVVEVMGRKAGHLAVRSGIAVAADVIIIPEMKPDFKKIQAYLEHNWRIGNHSMILIVTENTIPEGGIGLKKIIDKKHPEFDSRVTILGHIQRGGSPSAFDRTLASTLGYHAVTALLNGKANLMTGMVNGKIKFIKLADIADRLNAINPEWMKIANEFSLLD